MGAEVRKGVVVVVAVRGSGGDSDGGGEWQ